MLRLALVALPTLLAFGPPAETVSGKVVSVADGDTVDVLGRNKKPVRIRLHGIDAPERKQPFYAKSKQALGDMVHGKDVTVEVKDEDRYKREVGVVRLGETNVNVTLVCDGWAWHFVQYAKGNNELADAEREARKEKRGLWADSQPPVAPGGGRES